MVAATDETGATIWLGDNSAFGVATADAGLESRTAGYTGKDYDSEAGLYYFNARWYDPELGRFTTEDPARDSINWYVYCENSPMTYTDPDGRAPDKASNLTFSGSVTVSKPDYPNVAINATGPRNVSMNITGGQSIGMTVTLLPGSSISARSAENSFGI